ncbi:hypothetical protein KGF56_003087 [Candida oxycetoniae]|uniref:Carboxymuconolactone decarboxylase-like domain-containing protein n=1 Tax=Candida oxycetoniae TaxID=497107 RepID=A0AAI9WX87_9ASCO|nr:uncharacterized protein KGF56_003087 [Candida oxycetoniae]KAI3404051.1 hypothetical protein KGF56_003087 [Candida oxycetoniae]
MSLITPERLLKIAYHYPHIHNTWYLIATATLLELNLVEEIPAVLHFALRQQLFEFCNDEEKIISDEYLLRLAEDSISSSKACVKMYSTGVKIPDILIPVTYYKKIPLNYKYNRGEDVLKKQQFIVNQMREVILKLVSMVGLPKVINALTLLRAATPTRLVENTPKRPSQINYFNGGGEEIAAAATDTIDGQITPKSVNVKQVKSDLLEGSRLWNTVFSKNLGVRIRKQMLNAYPDLWYYINNHVYSYLLSYNHILTSKKTSLVIIACLIPQDVQPQLKGYLKGALNNGATKEEVMDTKSLALEICKWKTGIVSKPNL